NIDAVFGVCFFLEPLRLLCGLGLHIRRKGRAADKLLGKIQFRFVDISDEYLARAERRGRSGHEQASRAGALDENTLSRPEGSKTKGMDRDAKRLQEHSLLQTHMVRESVGEIFLRL